MSMTGAPAVTCQESSLHLLLLILSMLCRKGNVEDFISYGFYAKRTEDLTEEVRFHPHVLTLMTGHLEPWAEPWAISLSTLL